MPIALFFALALAQSAPADPAQSSASPLEDIAAGGASNLPKDDYGLVAWCHGALAGQLELDPIAHADMVSIEGKAKVAARAKSDAEMEKDRRDYLHQYERALAAAEKASPTAIHQYGVESELSGYKLWGATRQKQPIWRMLDWGMWDANDAGCSDAAKRLYNKASLFGEALKGSGEEKASDAKAEPTGPLPPAFTAHDAGAPVAETPPTTSTTAAEPPAAPASAAATPDAAAPDAPVVEAPPTAKTAVVKAKAGKAPKAKIAKPKTKAASPDDTPSQEEMTATPPPATSVQPTADQPAPPVDQLRGPQA